MDRQKGREGRGGADRCSCTRCASWPASGGRDASLVRSWLSMSKCAPSPRSRAAAASAWDVSGSAACAQNSSAARPSSSCTPHNPSDIERKRGTERGRGRETAGGRDRGGERETEGERTALPPA